VEVAQEGDEDRPPWHWSAIGTVAIFMAWLPLAFMVNGALSRLAPGDAVAVSPAARAAMVIVNLAAFALACFGGGFLVGRFGGQAGRREATVSGFAAASIACVLTATRTFQASVAAVVVWLLLLGALIAVGAGASRAGGDLGLKKRR
jgi:tRNA-(ms[2]io[6]A)-hydroxylase